MRSYKGDNERTLQHSLADTGRRNGCGNKREKEARHLWVRGNGTHAGLAQYSLRGDVVKPGIIVCDVGRTIIPSKQKGPVRAIVWNCMELDEEEASHLIIPLGKRRRLRDGRCMPGRACDASRVYVFTPLPPLLAPLYGTDTVRLRGSQNLRP